MNIKKIISLFLALTFLVTIQVEAVYPWFDIVVNAANDENTDIEKESEEDANDPKSITGTWKDPKNDKLVPPYGYFHNQVQDYIIKKYKGEYRLSKEQSVIFKEGLYPDGNKSGKGRADLYVEENNYAYFWEVKPGSCIEPSKLAKAKTQLKGYIADTIKSNKVIENRYGNKTYGDNEQIILEGEYSLSKVI